MTKVKYMVGIKTSPEKVWKYLTDLDKFHEWAPVKMRLTSEKQGLGATYHTTGKILGMNFEIDQKCTEWVKNKKWGYTMSFVGKEAKLSFLLNSYGLETKLTETFEYELPHSFFGKFIDKLLFRWYLKKMIKNELENLKNLLEGR